MTLLANDDLNTVIGTVSPPPQVSGLIDKGGSGSVGIGYVLTTVIQLLYMSAGIIFVFMVVIGAVQWILAGGDKDKIASAQKRITQSIIGLVVLALAFFIIKVIGNVLGFNLFDLSNIFVPDPTDKYCAGRTFGCH